MGRSRHTVASEQAATTATPAVYDDKAVELGGRRESESESTDNGRCGQGEHSL